MTAQLHRDFPGFYDNGAIALIADEPRWTVSDNNKRPLDMVQLIRSMNDELEPSEPGIRGAARIDASTLVTLDELIAALPQASNHAFHLNAASDGVAMIDIEPSCPEGLREALLQIPCLYAERSMSGRGYHLVLPLPKNFHQYPAAVSKKAVKGPGGHFEILLEHWMTFTRDVISHQPWEGSSPVWEGLWAQLAAEVEHTALAQLEIDQDKPHIPHEELLLNRLRSTALRKSLADFGGDHSSYEFSVIGTICNALDEHLAQLAQVRAIDSVDDYDHTQRAWLIYQSVVAKIPHRDKHDELRNSMPLLFDRTVFVLAGRAGQQQS